MSRTSLTSEQKLSALSLKHWDNLKWKPKKGDYYTSSRDDLELYKIVEETEDYFYTKYCNPEFSDEMQKWPKESFLKEFGVHRVYVPDFLFKD